MHRLLSFRLTILYRLSRVFFRLIIYPYALFRLQQRVVRPYAVTALAAVCPYLIYYLIVLGNTLIGDKTFQLTNRLGVPVCTYIIRSRYILAAQRYIVKRTLIRFCKRLQIKRRRVLVILIIHHCHSPAQNLK